MFTIAFFISSLLLFAQATSLNNASLVFDKDCIRNPTARYNGTVNVTRTGKACKRWSEATSSNSINLTIFDGTDHNYCRNPNNDLQGTWCYTEILSRKWEYCRIPKCPDDDSKVFWTYYDEIDGVSHIVSIDANPELVRESTDMNGHFNISVLTLTSQANTEYWALAGDYERNILIYTDYRSHHILVQNLTTHSTTKKFDGMAHGIDSLAFDWSTGNLYWTDNALRWVGVTDKNFLYYKNIYNTNNKDVVPFALSIHVENRALYFSTYQPENTSIIVSDLTGRNARILFQFPVIIDVTGLTVDSRDNRLYFTDFVGFGSKVYSSALDGSNLKLLVFKQNAFYWHLAVYMDYLYATDLKRRNSLNSSSHYSIWLIAKGTDKTYEYALKGKPRGITVLNSDQGFNRTNGSRLNECNDASLPPCEHICLPSSNMSRECLCSLGYKKVGESGCVTEYLEDNFVLVSDAGQGRMFQISLNYTSDFNYNIIKPKSPKTRVSCIAVDPLNFEYYWSDRSDGTISRVKSDGSDERIIANNVYVYHMEIHPCSKDIFYIDALTKTIKVMDSLGRYRQTLLNTSYNELRNVSLQALTLDLINRKIYWTDTKEKIGRGQVWRMNFDGSDQELVIDRLNWPRAITVDHNRKSIFIAEARTAVIYEQPLSQLVNITNHSHSSIEKQYDLLDYLGLAEAYITDIKVFGELLYFHDGRGVKLQSFNLTSGPASLSSFGPSEFFILSSLAIFSSKSLAHNIDCTTSICSCTHICVTVGSDDSNSTKRCLCGDFYDGADCDHRLAINYPPNFGNSCPEDQTLNLGGCMSFLSSPWKPPVWSDDNTPTNQLRLTYPNVTKLGVGLTVVEYTATDGDNLTSVCSFIVNIVDVNCGPAPSFPDFLSSSGLLCGHAMGSGFKLTCQNTTKALYYEGKPSSDVFITCDESGNWIGLPDFKNLTCRTHQNVHKKTQIASVVISIVVVFFLLLSTIIFFRLRRRGVSWMAKTNFPKVWRETEDTNSEMPSMENLQLQTFKISEIDDEEEKDEALEFDVDYPILKIQAEVTRTNK